jgi:putative membrane protein
MAEVPNDRRAAEYLANERTFLAWLRTSIAILSLGFALAKFSVWMRDLGLQIGRPFRESSASVPMGEALMALGGLLTLLAAWHYHAINRAIEEDRVRPNRALVALITAAVVLLAFVMAWALHLARPNP